MGGVLFTVYPKTATYPATWIFPNSYTTQIQARIDSQMPLSEKCDRADVIIYNDGSLQHLYQQCDRALKGEGV
ncbi:protein of unknown function [Limnospira indica PCC 8005]|uniref:Uncharacterized protein n=1 Tax=Limnospira indica PCC 8005 TaxID=376219 RepID=A0A9P1KAK8_9CYAN|nr:protein of unknown function [Limnospira indica PCC 8005]